MSQPRIGAMLHYLSGGSKHGAEEYYGRTVADAKLDDNRLKLRFTDGTRVDLWDNGQSCCENRYMTTDDDLKSLIGGRLTRIEAKSGGDVDYGHEDVHETVFVEIGTDKAFVTLCNHNEHNGYYGGFALTLTEPEPVA